LSSDPSEAAPEVLLALDQILVERDMTLTELSRKTGITMANLSILKNNKARAVRLSTLAALCHALDVTPGELFVVEDAAPGLKQNPAAHASGLPD